MVFCQEIKVMAEKFFWNWLNIGRDGQPIEGESGGGQQVARSSLPNNSAVSFELSRTIAATLWLVLMFAIFPLVLARVLLDKTLRILVKPIVKLDRFANGS